MLDSILGIANKLIPDKNKKYDALIEMSKSDSEATRADAAILVKEMETGSGSWRPRVAYLLCAYFLIFSGLYFLAPAIIVMGDLNVYYLEPTPDAMFSLLIASVILLSLVIGREIVKLIRALKGKIL